MTLPLRLASCHLFTCLLPPHRRLSSSGFRPQLPSYHYPTLFCLLTFLLWLSKRVGSQHGSRRTLHSGKEFSIYDLVIGKPVQSPQYFSVAECLKERLEAQEITKIYDEPADIMPPPPSPSPSPPPSPSPLGSPRPFWQKPPRDLPAKPAKVPTTVQETRPKEAQETEVGARGRRIRGPGPQEYPPHSTSTSMLATSTFQACMGWKSQRVGRFGGSGGGFEAGALTLDAGILYTQEEPDALSGTEGFGITILIIDSHRRLIPLLGGKPKDLVGWKRITDAAAELMANGGGQTQPGELCNNTANTEITDELLAHE
ncbi:hypothetical protein B0H13DRAFT_1850922 [Mycena leptocephala]|nr:hypothetical protein B0H13DRAFT_1850922 [Mycena leptocephala]